MSETADWVRLASAADVEPGEMLAVDIRDLNLALYHLEDGSWHCTDNVCTHAFAVLTDGWLEDHVIECPLHGGKFDVRTGKGLCEPVEEDLRTYPVRLDGDAVMVALPQAG